MSNSVNIFKLFINKMENYKKIKKLPYQRKILDFLYYIVILEFIPRGNPIKYHPITIIK